MMFLQKIIYIRFPSRTPPPTKASPFPNCTSSVPSSCNDSFSARKTALFSTRIWTAKACGLYSALNWKRSTFPHKSTVYCDWPFPVLPPVVETQIYFRFAHSQCCWNGLSPIASTTRSCVCSESSWPFYTTSEYHCPVSSPDRQSQAKTTWSSSDLSPPFPNWYPWTFGADW